MPNLISSKELAAMLGIDKKLLYRLVREGQGPRAIRIGNLVRFDPRDCREWLESRKG